MCVLNHFYNVENRSSFIMWNIKLSLNISHSLTWKTTQKSLLNYYFILTELISCPLSPFIVSANKTSTTYSCEWRSFHWKLSFMMGRQQNWSAVPSILPPTCLCTCPLLFTLCFLPPWEKLAWSFWKHRDICIQASKWHFLWDMDFFLFYCVVCTSCDV